MDEEKILRNEPYIPDENPNNHIEDVPIEVEDVKPVEDNVPHEEQPQESYQQNLFDFYNLDDGEPLPSDDFLYNKEQDVEEQASFNEEIPFEDVREKEDFQEQPPFSFKNNEQAQTRAPFVLNKEEKGPEQIVIKKGVGPLGIIGICILSLCCGLAGGVYSTKLYKESPTYQQPVITYSVNPTLISDTNVKTLNDVSEIVTETMPSIVSITSMIEQSSLEFGFDFGSFETPASGSGVIYSQTDNEILIITNYHVIEDTKGLTVGWFDGTTSTASIKGYSVADDIALVSVNIDDISEATLKNLKIAVIGDSDSSVVGEGVIAIGNALGYGQTVTDGIISALNREVDFDDGTSMFMMQTSAAINPGNSGGALLNSRGELIGINAAKYSDTNVEGIGYAIPINHIEPILQDIVAGKIESNTEIPTTLKLGITGYDITSDMSELYNMPVGICVQEVEADSVAELAGIKPGDIITKVNNLPMQSITQLKSIIQNLSKGDEIILTIQRQDGSEYKEIEVTAKF